MFKLDDNLLRELGLGALPAGEKNKMLGHIYETLEMRVGMKLAEQMSNEQLDEFERFIDGDMDYAHQFLNAQKPGWEQSEEYKKSVDSAQATAERDGRPFNQNAVTSEFAALTWLEANFPNYKQVVADELDKLKEEIKQAAPQILSASVQPPTAPEQQPPAAA